MAAASKPPPDKQWLESLGREMLEHRREFPVVDTLIKYMGKRQLGRTMLYTAPDPITNDASVNDVLGHAYSHFKGSGAHMTSLDSLVRHFGEYDEFSTDRLRFAIDLTAFGADTAFQFTWVVAELAKKLKLNATVLESRLREMITEGSIHSHEDLIQIDDDFRAETDIATVVASRNELDLDSYQQFSDDLTEYNLDPSQREAVLTAGEHCTCVITGGPGTGKTHTIRAIISQWSRLISSEEPPPQPSKKTKKQHQQQQQKPQSRVLLMAPSHCARIRMQESTGLPAVTAQSFAANPNAPSTKGKLVVVDESSMIETRVFAAILARASDCDKLVLVGDVDQLPSIGNGLVLFDLIHSDKVPVSRMLTSHRQTPASIGIGTLAAQIRNGERICLSREYPGVRFIATDSRPEALDILAGLVASDGFQIISPTKVAHHKLGAISLNRAVSLKLGGTGDIGQGDRVIVIRSDEEDDPQFFNGDIDAVERLERINREDCAVLTRIKKPVPLHSLELAYAITIHKSQGSEFNRVAIPIANESIRMLTRELVYTAVTRAKIEVVFVGEVGLLCGEFRRDMRKTLLGEKLSVAST